MFYDFIPTSMCTFSAITIKYARLSVPTFTSLSVTLDAFKLTHWTFWSKNPIKLPIVQRWTLLKYKEFRYAFGLFARFHGWP